MCPHLIAVCLHLEIPLNGLKLKRKKLKCRRQRKKTTATGSPVPSASSSPIPSVSSTSVAPAGSQLPTSTAPVMTLRPRAKAVVGEKKGAPGRSKQASKALNLN